MANNSSERGERPSANVAPLHTVLCDMLQCRYPLVQTAMGYVALPELVAATCNAGGFGFLAAVTLKPEEVESAIVKTASLTRRKFGVNFHMLAPGASLVADSILRHRDKVAAVGYGRGPDPQMIKRFRRAGLFMIPTAGKTEHAITAVNMGADAIIVQGGEGGGHTGSVPTSILLPQTVDAVDVPVVAAGGFKDGRGLVAALAYGAVGIAMGTRFLMTTDSPVPAAAKQAYVDVTDIDCIGISRVLDGLPLRLIRNQLLEKLERGNALASLLFALSNAWRYRRIAGMSAIEALKNARAFRRSGLSVTQTLLAASAAALYHRTWLEGRPESGALPSGQVAAAIDCLQSCEDVVNDIMSQAQRCVKTFQC